ncbi:hypothetical protein I4U23_029617 [Adineta vaga]|nr:hypothetical protein I4U23_029617 [Adineta vaga]
MSITSGYLPTCNPNIVPHVANTSYPFTPRRAADTTGRFGLLYDASCDKMLHSSYTNLRKITVQSSQKPQCYTKTCTTDQTRNLLKWYNIYSELRLSIALEMLPAVGVGALNNYSYPINKYTRFICYNYISHTEYLSNEDFLVRNTTAPSYLDPLATHIIVLVNWSITAVAIIQLPPEDELVKDIDLATDKLCSILSHDQAPSKLSADEEFYLKKIISTKIFSNIDQLSEVNSIIDFYNTILRFENKVNIHKPYNYNLCYLEHFFDRTSGLQFRSKELISTCRRELECYLIQLSIDFKSLRTKIKQDYPNIEGTRTHQLNHVCTVWSDFEKLYRHRIEQLRDLVIKVRQRNVEDDHIHHALNDNIGYVLQKQIEELGSCLGKLREKEAFIDDLLQKHIEYRDAADYNISSKDDQESVRHKLNVGLNRETIICSTDRLYKEKYSEWRNLASQLLKERDQNSQLQLVYVDFTDCSYALCNFLVFPSIRTNDNAKQPLSLSTTSSSASSQPRMTTPSSNKSPSTPTISSDQPKSTTTTTTADEPSSKPQQSDDQIKNILLVGESGVGKSTFINALVNYLRFDSLEQARKKPIVLMPVSFIMTVDDNFTEQHIKLDGEDNVSSEDFSDCGLSVTQHCKSYLITLPTGLGSKRKVRIIDTPGIGDVRGLAQDDANMQHILSFVNNLTHLNAICILMKPNTTRLNVFFRECFLQLYDFLGDDAREKILFCFTNARSTFYTPGNTAPLLKQLLQSLPGKQIPFTKQNTFCYDSESFRYLVAVESGIQFDNDQKQEYTESWKRSSGEAERLLDHICNLMTTPVSPGTIKSVKHAHVDINHMIRPLLETIRNTLRNIILQSDRSCKNAIELCPRLIKISTAICSKCTRSLRPLDNFWIFADNLHVSYNRCRTCDCDADHHFPIDYELEYKLCQQDANNTERDMLRTVDELCETSAEFSFFLLKDVESSRQDPFLLGFKRMIKEEADICAEKEENTLNTKLRDALEEIKKKYEDRKLKLKAENAELSVADIYSKMENINRNKMVASQMAAMQQWQKYMIRHYEYRLTV